MGSAETKPRVNHTKLDPIPSEYATNGIDLKRSLDYREALVHKFMESPVHLPPDILSVIISYIPPLFTVYKISRRKSSSHRSMASHSQIGHHPNGFNNGRAPSPTPSVCSVASSITSIGSITSYTSTASSISSQFTSEIRIDRLSEWESMLFCADSVYRIGKKYFVKAANHEIYGMGRHKKVSLGTNLEFMSSGICAGTIAIKYQNGNLYTSRFRSTSFHKFSWRHTVSITKIECGFRHSLFLSVDGQLYSMGDNSRGQCGVDTLEVHRDQIAVVDTLVELNCFITAISCGYQHCFVSHFVHSLTDSLTH